MLFFLDIVLEIFAQAEMTIKGHPVSLVIALFCRSYMTSFIVTMSLSCTFFVIAAYIAGIFVPNLCLMSQREFLRKFSD